MNYTKLNDWLQIAAALGVIVGLGLVAYELRLSNRIGWEQASADALDRWDNVSEMSLLPGMAELFLRAHQGEELSREEAIFMNAYIDTGLSTILHDYRLYLTGSLVLPQGWESAYNRIIQYYAGSPYARRKWETSKVAWQPDFVSVVDNALVAEEQRDVIGEIDYARVAIRVTD